MAQEFNKVHWSSKSYHWNTPLDLFNELNKEFNFNLDPTNRPIGGLPGLNDGLREKWIVHSKKTIVPFRAFINPPYKRGLIVEWVSKCLKEMRLKNGDLAVFLLPLRNSDYLKLLRKHGTVFRLCEKRLKFGDADGSSKSNGKDGAPFDSIVCILKRENI